VRVWSDSGVRCIDDPAHRFSSREEYEANYNKYHPSQAVIKALEREYLDNKKVELYLPLLNRMRIASPKKV
jgi:hypothetical protein